MSKLVNMIKGIFLHWNKPADGRYVSNKEIAAYSVGGIGVMFVAAVVGQIALSTNCLLLGSIYGMTPNELTILLTANTIFTLVSQPLKSYWIDNVGAKNSSRGKARPFILWLGFPSVVLCSLVAFVQPNWSHTLIITLIGVVFIFMNFIYQFYYGMYIQLSQLISPNTAERADIISVSSIVYSMAPTITGFFFPLISKLFPLGQLDQRFYQIIFPVFGVIGAALSLIAYFGTKERVVVAKKYVAKVKFKDGMKAILGNRYFWINNISSWFAFARGGITGLLTWGYIYILQNEVTQSFLTLIMGTASLVGMALAPLLCRLLGKRNTVLLTNAIVAVAAGVFMLFPNSFVGLAIVLYVVYWAVAVQMITSPAMNADALDYQQWKTGDRLEGFSQNFAIIGSIVMLGTNLLLPAINTYFGLLDNYDFLYDPSLRAPMYRILALVTCIGSVLFLLPFLFWDLNEKKHAQIIEDLKLRAKQQNKADGFADAGVLSSGEILEAELTEEERAALHAQHANGEITQEELLRALQDNSIQSQTLEATPGQPEQAASARADMLNAQDNQAEEETRHEEE